MTRPLPLPLPWALDWERRLIAVAGNQPIPAYGSRDWHALPENSAIRVAACVLAAAAWRTYTDPAEVARRLRLEVDEAHELDRLEQDLDDWTPTLTRQQAAAYSRPGPSQGELARRRKDPAAAARVGRQAAAIADAFPLQEGAA